MHKSNPNAQERSDDEPTADQDCPECGGPIRGIERTGVTGNATVVPCGHPIGAVTVRDLSQSSRRLAPDGGTPHAEDSSMTSTDTSSDDDTRSHQLMFAIATLATGGILLMDNTATLFALPTMFLAGYAGAQWQAARGENSE